MPPKMRTMIRTAPAAAMVAALASLTLFAQGASQTAPSQRDPARGRGEFRHYPRGKPIPGLDAGARSIEGPLAAEANREFPSGVRVLPAARPVVSQAGRNQVYRFSLEYEGVPLAAGTDYVAILHPGGRVLASRARNLPQSVDATRPATDAATAATVAVDHARRTFDLTGSLTVASPRLEVWVDAERAGRLSWRLIVRAVDGDAARSFAYRISAAGDPEVLEARELRYYGTVHAQGNIWQTSPLLAPASVAFPDLDVVLSGSPVITDANGDASVPAGTAIGGRLRGPFAVISDAAGPLLTRPAMASAGHDVLDYDAATEFELAETTAFYWASRANRWVRTYVPSLNGAETALDGLRVRVNQSGVSCNAFTDGFEITTGRASAFCANTAVATLVVHELGHVVHFALAEGVFDAAYSEGFGDALAAFVTGDPCQGRDIAGAGSCFRDATNVTLYPANVPDVHTQGEPYAQFAWALALDLGIDPAAQLILGAAAASPADIEDAVHLSFVVDDDDGQLSTCSVNQRALEQAADSRTLPRPVDCADVGTVLAGVLPNSPANHNMPSFHGTTAPGVPVGLFSTAGCTGSPLSTSIADSTGGFAIPLIVSDNSSTTVFAKALPTDGRTGACSSGITYVEDSLPPPAPSQLSTTPASPSTSRTPIISGSAPDAARVRIYVNTCSGNPVATAAVVSSVFSAQLSVAEFSTTTFVAAAEDVAGNVSACSAALTYVHRPPSVSIADAAIFEGRAGQLPVLMFEVSLSEAATGSVRVAFATSDGTAAASSDYRAQTGSVSFAPGERSKAIGIAVVGDGLVEKDESMSVRISASGATVARGAALGTIRNDDNVGVATVAPSVATARPGDVVPFEFGWVVPAAKPDGTLTNNSWRDLTTMTLRLIDDNGLVAFEVVWIQENNTFQVRRGRGAYGGAFSPGDEAGVEESAFFELDPSDVIVRTAPGAEVALVLPLRARRAAAGRTFHVEGAAIDDFGDEQPFERLGALTVRR
jgi:hypothetical protein